MMSRWPLVGNEMQAEGSYRNNVVGVFGGLRQAERRVLVFYIYIYI